MYSVYTSIPFIGAELNTNSVLKAQEHIRNKFKGNKVYFVPVAAFGIAYTVYLDNEMYGNSNDWEMDNECGIIIYTNEASRASDSVAKARGRFQPNKVIKP